MFNSRNWADDFDEMDFSNPPIFNEYPIFNKYSKFIDEYIYKLCKLPMDFIPESDYRRRRLDIFVKISH